MFSYLDQFSYPNCNLIFDNFLFLELIQHTLFWISLFPVIQIKYKAEISWTECVCKASTQRLDFVTKSLAGAYYLEEKDEEKEIVIWLNLRILGGCCSQFVLFCFIWGSSIILGMVYIPHQKQNTMVYDSVLLMSPVQSFLYSLLHLLKIREKSLSPFTSTVEVFLKDPLLVPHNPPYFLSTFSDQYKENNILE